MDFYIANTDLVQTLVVIFGIGCGLVSWAIVFCTAD